jgi:CheY-like chemotaxis protein
MIVYADSGVLAVQVAEVNNFDIVFLDIHMPILDGLTVAGLLRKRAPQTKLVGVSADEPPDNTPFDAYVQKPFNRTQFQSILSRFFTSETDVHSVGSF